MKYIEPYTIEQLQQFNDNINDHIYNKSPFIVTPKLNIKLIKHICGNPKILHINDNLSIKNHLISNENINDDIHKLLTSFKYEIDDKYSFGNYNQKILLQLNLIPKCSVKILLKYEEEYGIKYLITDKSLGIAIIDIKLYHEIISKEMNKILKHIKSATNPQLIKQYAINFAYEHQNVMDSYNHIPNKTLTILINDIKKAKNGYFNINPLYKAHKYIQETPYSPKIHNPKIRPVISGLNSPLLPILKIIAEACKIIMVNLLNEYQSINIAQDSYHVINIINNYMKNNYHPTDIIISFDFESFYTELPYNFIQNKLTKAYNMFMDKYHKFKDIKYKKYAQMIILIQNGCELASKYCIIKINDSYYLQKQGVIMGASCAPNLSNLSILIHNIENNIHKCKMIKVYIRQIDDTLIICKNMHLNDIIKLFQQFNPKILKFTTTPMIDNQIKFLDILFIKINNKLEYCMQFKPLKTEFFVPFQSNHPIHMKSNIITNMVNRAVILCSNYILFFHTMIALRVRLIKSGYNTKFLNRYMNESVYNQRFNIIKKLNKKRILKTNIILNNHKIRYKSIFPNNPNIVRIPYTKSLKRGIKRKLKHKYPKRFFVNKLNKSIYRIIRYKDANDKLI